jgi:hypothetical protein
MCLYGKSKLDNQPNRILEAQAVNNLLVYKLNIFKMFSIFKRRSKKLNLLTHFEIDNQDLLIKFSEINRESLRLIPNWIPANNFKNSYFNYGVPESIVNLLNLPLGRSITYTDLISYLVRDFKAINYFEIGVSVGKNFYQLANQFKDSHLTGFDIENINPVLEDEFIYKNKIEWDLQIKSVRTEKATISEYDYKTNKIKYLAGDIWDESCWEKLDGHKFNVIFSDALHEPKALLWEYEMIKKYNLLAMDFIFIWDDLNNGLEESFKEIIMDFKKNEFQEYKSYLFKINGWLGENYPLKHDVGILTNINLK